jgi:[ribosomal protein S18]-alanine N-acetyltransferase
MIIRNMQESDLDQVITIEQQTFSDPWSEEDFINSMREPNNKYLIAEIDGSVAGYCGYWGIAGEGCIYNVAVKKEFRRQQIAFQLLTTIIEEGAKAGMEAFTLEVRVTNTPAIRLYERLGFEQAGIRKDFYTKPKEDAVIMWLKLIQ